jgi:hypothetical protein
MPADNRSTIVCLHANYALLDYYAESSGNFLRMFGCTLSVPSSKKILGFLTLADGTERLPRTSVRNYHYSLRNNPKKVQLSSTSQRKLEITLFCSRFLSKTTKIYSIQKCQYVCCFISAFNIASHIVGRI